MIWPEVASAYRAEFPAPERYEDTIIVEEPEIQRSYFGILDNFPHTYRLTAEEPFILSVALYEPDDREVALDKSLIIVKDEKRQGVSLVARLAAGEASWEPYIDRIGNDHYRSGGIWSGELPEGTYLVEVSTPDNRGKYMLSVGTERPWGIRAYVGAIADLFLVKRFLGQSYLSVLLSPLVYAPLGVVFLMGISWWYWRRHGSMVHVHS